MRQSETRNLVIATPVTLNILIDDGFGAIIVKKISLKLAMLFMQKVKH